MPPPLNYSDYDYFSLEDVDRESLKLDEAIQKASELRVEHPDKVYRVTPIDSDMTAFQIKQVSKAQLFAEFTAKLAAHWAKLLSSVSR